MHHTFSSTIFNPFPVNAGDNGLTLDSSNYYQNITNINVDKLSKYIDFKDDDIVFLIKGHSMLPKFQENDKILCRKVVDKDAIKGYKEYVIFTNDYGYVLKYLKIEKSKIRLISSNPQYAEIQIPIPQKPVQIWEVIQLNRIM